MSTQQRGQPLYDEQTFCSSPAINCLYISTFDDRKHPNNGQNAHLHSWYNGDSTV